MKTRKFLVSIFTFMSVLLLACGPAAMSTSVVPTSVRPTEVVPMQTADNFILAGDPIPEKYLNIDFLTGEGKQLAALRLRSSSDPICQALNTEENCFTILMPNNPTDPGARGPVAIVNGLIAAKFQLVPYGPDDVGSIEYFEPKDDGGVLTGVKCETKTGSACNADVGSTWKSAHQQTTWHSPENSAFRLSMNFTYGSGWVPITGDAPQTLDLIYEGNPTTSQSEWWGPSIVLVNGAQVPDPKEMTKLMPWPDDFFAYFASLPGVEVVQGPGEVTFGGVQGTQVIAHVSSFGPFIWLKNDSAWFAKKSSPDDKWQLILMDVNGEHVLLWFPESAQKFDERYPLVQEIFNSITFGK
jgi:hypothetical protein